MIRMKNDHQLDRSRSQEESGGHYSASINVEFHRDIMPILERSWLACHSVKHKEPSGKLAIDDDRPIAKTGLVPWAERDMTSDGSSLACKHGPRPPRSLPQPHVRRHVDIAFSSRLRL